MKNSVFYVSMVAASKYIGAGIAVLGVIGAGIGVGIIFAGYMASVARNPYLQNALLRYVFLGFALTEALGLLSIMMAFLILYA
jgi:F-type H+-transporting ATPase subunit c